MNAAVPAALMLSIAVSGVVVSGARDRPQAPQDIADRAELDFAQGRVAESVAGYDRLAALVPSAAPSLWQRGVGLYILGRYDECASQFLSFFKENPEDLENAAWHFLCVARSQSVERARAAMLDAGPDSRILRTQVYEMLRGVRTAASLLELVRVSIPLAQFYAHLYVGLFADASGDRTAALEHLTVATSDRYRGLGGFMNVVAHVYAARLKEMTSDGRKNDVGRVGIFRQKTSDVTLLTGPVERRR